MRDYHTDFVLLLKGRKMKSYSDGGPREEGSYHRKKYLKKRKAQKRARKRQR